MRRQRSTERGIAAVEFALVAPFVLMLLLGMVTTAFAYSDHLAVTNAVREGARYGAAVDYSASGWATSVKDRIQQVYFNSGSTVSNSEICVKAIDSTKTTITGTTYTGSSCGTAPDLSSLTMTSGSCAVVAWVRKPASIQLVIAPTLHFNIGSKSVVFYGRTVTTPSGSTCTAS